MFWEAIGLLYGIFTACYTLNKSLRRWIMRKDGLARLIFLAVSAFVICSFCGHSLYASSSIRPASPPPAGKVWVKAESGWRLVPVPPADAPYTWVKDHWEKIVDIPPGKEWVPSYWGENGWVPAHWCPVVYPHPDAKWVSGHWDAEGRWISGHWVIPPELQARLHRQWVPGHRAPGGAWIHGYWE
jgi:hypothetical protein